MMTGLNPDRIRQGLAVLDEQPRGADRLPRPVADYTATNVSDKVVRIILSYTDYVRRVVWRKPAPGPAETRPPSAAPVPINSPSRNPSD